MSSSSNIRILSRVLFQPSIFGTVASELTPKDGSSRKVRVLRASVTRFIFKFNSTKPEID